jgi:hypothetical protein
MKLVVAYHGCDIATRDALVEGRTRLLPSTNPYDWLGDGIYFFESDWRRAMQFAEAAFNRPQDRLTQRPIRDPAVVGAILCVERWLDMSTQKGIDEFARTYRALIESGMRLRPNKRTSAEDSDFVLRHLDRRVFNALHQRRDAEHLPPYDAVRGGFPQGYPVAPTSSIRRKTHVQIALRNPSCAIGYFRVTEADDRTDALALEATVRN